VAGYSIIGFFGPVVSLIISIGMSNVAGATKKSFMAAAIFVAYCVGNIIGPQLIITPTVKQHYPTLWLGLIIWYHPLPSPVSPPTPTHLNSYIIVILLAIILFFVLRRENARRDALPVDEDERDRMAFLDLTDKENVYFRYVW